MKKNTLKSRYLFALVLLPILVLTALLFAAKPIVTAQAQSLSPINMLSQMSEQDCVDFIIENGIEIPDDFANLTNGDGGDLRWLSQN